jgi:membrane-associated phospholipid phosphatase
MRPSERLTSVALLALSAVVAARAPASGALLLPGVALVLGATWLLAARGVRRGPLGFVRDFLPVAVVLGVFSLLQPAIEALNPHRYDATLAALDDRWAAALVAAWRGFLGRPAPFTDLVYAGYASYYALLLGPLVMARVRRRDRLDPTTLTMLVGMYLCFAGYLTFPTSGPRLPLELEPTLGGGAVSEGVRAFLRAAEATTLDAFPSGHTGMSIVAAVVAWRLAPRSAWVYVPWATLMVFATVYIHVHYAFDVLGGVLLALFTLVIDRPVARLLGDAGELEHVADSLRAEA